MCQRTLLFQLVPTQLQADIRKNSFQRENFQMLQSHKNIIYLLDQYQPFLKEFLCPRLPLKITNDKLSLHKIQKTHIIQFLLIYIRLANDRAHLLNSLVGKYYCHRCSRILQGNLNLIHKLTQFNLQKHKWNQYRFHYNMCHHWLYYSQHQQKYMIQVLELVLKMARNMFLKGLLNRKVVHKGSIDLRDTC